MCGLAGFLHLANRDGEEALLAAARRMAGTLRHRGPDREGAWADASAGIALGFRRLSILDLSPAGDQPMISNSGRYVLCFNGEIYNVQDLRRKLAPHAIAFRGHSDTEVLLEAIDAWGLEVALTEAVGMFAMALWNREARELWLARDRLGKKPLYWSQQGPLLLFGSELRALRAHAAFAAEVDRDALVGFIRRGYFHHPSTVYRGVQQLPPGGLLRIGGNGQVAVQTYWTLREVCRSAAAHPFKGSLAEAVDGLEALLKEAVGQRMLADVPVGALLSGGYDSSTVVALMQAQSNRAVRTFSIGFRESDYDEAGHAAAVARRLGTEHTELVLTPKDALAVVPRLPEIYDEPFADSSAIPTYLVCQLARTQVIVALSGDGGDEVFAGYNRYAQGERVRRRIAALPLGVRRALAAGMRSTPPGTWEHLAQVLPESARPRQIGDKIHKLADVIAANDEAAYLRLTSQWPDPEDVVIGGRELSFLEADQELKRLLPQRVERMQYLDTVSYLPGDILTKVDRASMAVSLEARSPLLDHRVVAFAWSLPHEYKISRGRSKWVMRQVLYRHVPPALVDRAKSGFAVPIGDWLRGPLKDWAEDLLDARRLKAAGILNPDPIRRRWQEHLQGRRNWEHALWSVLMFEAWRRLHAVGPSH
ncbi:MAG TPA: asparagine synthase (glutamine-hydrolyzing) [Hyphomicrobiaceae bacterium]|nr:asparagine synthase (glutamine-hydrolyzing) [Hyphomicrobiaceae bacterium]